MAPKCVAEAGPSPSHTDAGEETDIDVEIVDEGDDGRSRVINAELDKYVEQGLLKALLHGLCCTPG